MKTLYEGFEGEGDNCSEIQGIYQSLTGTISSLCELTTIIIRQPAHNRPRRRTRVRRDRRERVTIPDGFWICVSSSYTNSHCYRD